MKADVVVDVGNSRVKWGRCDMTGITGIVALPHDVNAWDEQAHNWRDVLPAPTHWTVAGVVPFTIDRLRDWAIARGDQIEVVTSYEQIPIRVDVDQPESVGLDRILGAAAARALFPGRKLLVVDAGSAVTINLIDGAFRGGAIFPGLRLMAEAMHAQTAKLPKVTLDKPEAFPGRNTDAAIRAGLCTVMIGAVERCARLIQPDAIIFTGGDGALLESMIEWPNKRFEPALNLMGLWRTAGSMPSQPS
jgi:type III pantothenate kinase